MPPTTPATTALGSTTGRRRTVALIRHPDSPTLGVTGVEATIDLAADGHLNVDYVLSGAVAALRIPAPGPVRPGERLWAHTCFEAFVRIDGLPAYTEYNFAPSRQWATYRFREYRDPLENPVGPAPRIEVRPGDDRIELSVQLSDFSGVSTSGGRRLRIGLSAVVESASGDLAYWALRHAPGRPDFHHADAFALELPSSGNTP